MTDLYCVSTFTPVCLFPSGCAAYEITPDKFNVDTRSHDAVVAHEEFVKEPLLKEEVDKRLTSL